MSTAFRRLPTLRSYAEALKHHNTSTPIRGRAPELRPLARFTAGRRDADRFSIRLRSNPLQPDSPPSVECVLYKTPVVTFHPNNTVTITTGTHYEPSSSTATFIHNILPFCSASRTGGRIVLTARTEDAQFLKHSIAKGEGMTFYLNLGDRYYNMTPVNPEPQTTIVMDRAAANNVRARYGEFYRYLKSAISLRTEQTTTNNPHIKTSVNELRAVLPNSRYSDHKLKPSGRVLWQFDMPGLFHMTEKPALNESAPTLAVFQGVPKIKHTRNFTNYPDWRTTVEDFLQLIKPNSDPQVQAENFYKAFMSLTYWCSSMSLNNTFAVDDHASPRYANPEGVRALIDEIIFKYHSTEVFKRQPVKPGQAPGVKYNKWVDWTL